MMRYRFAARRLVTAAVLAGVSAPASSIADADADEARWQVLVPAGRIGRFDIRIERSSFDDEPRAAADRIERAWRAESGVALQSADGPARSVSRLTAEGLELVTLAPSADGGSEARRSVLRLRDAARATPEPTVMAAFASLGPPLGGFVSHDAGRDGVTRVWLLDTTVADAAQRVERLVAMHGLVPTMRFAAPDDAAATVRDARLIAVAGQGNNAVVTLTRHGSRVAVVVHCQVSAQ